MDIQKVGMVIHPVEDLDAAARFYRETLGLRELFRDGDRFCAFDAKGVTIALAAGDEAVASAPAVSYKVADLDSAIDELVAGGASLVRPASAGRHEVRALLRDPAGNAFIVYAPLEGR
ncbi:MAG: VOC family protein [Deltaproteobacteria bacterium]|nr:VOC family protein [Deltaproteobacteria bacterium]